MMINNINNFIINIEDEVIDSLQHINDKLLIDVLKELTLEEIESPDLWHIAYMTGAEIYYYWEADEILDNVEYSDIKWASENVEFNGDFEDFKFQIARDLLNDYNYNEVSKVFDNLEVE